MGVCDWGGVENKDTEIIKNYDKGSIRESTVSQELSSLSNEAK